MKNIKRFIISVYVIIVTISFLPSCAKFSSEQLLRQ
jgi:hypothetical protein